MPDRIHFLSVSRVDYDEFKFKGRLEIDQPVNLLLAEALAKPFTLPILDNHNPQRPIGKIEHFGQGKVEGSIYFFALRPTMVISAGYRMANVALNKESTVELGELSLMTELARDPEPAVPAEAPSWVSSSSVKVVRKVDEGKLKTLCSVHVRPGEVITVTVDANAVVEVTF